MFEICGFAQIVNASTSLKRVNGVLTLEVKDKTNGWIFDYEHSKQHFIDWSSEIFNATNGKSHGNVRLMHQLKVVGRITKELEFDDTNKRILCEAEISDDEVWNGILNGDYCGFSFSGKKVPATQDVLRNWANMPDGASRYIGKPVEVSIVDNPNQAGAYFSVVNAAGHPIIIIEKEDGTKVEKEFVTNTSMYDLTYLIEHINNIRWTSTGDSILQDKFNKAITNLMTIVVEMAKNIKSEFKEEPAVTANVVREETNMEVEKKDEIFNAAQTSALTEIVNAAVAPVVASAIAEAIKGLGIDELKSKVNSIANVTAAPTTTVVKEVDSVTTVIPDTSKNVVQFVANAAEGISDNDAKALNKIAKLTSKAGK